MTMFQFSTARPTARRLKAGVYPAIYGRIGPKSGKIAAKTNIHKIINLARATMRDLRHLWLYLAALNSVPLGQPTTNAVQHLDNFPGKT